MATVTDFSQDMIERFLNAQGLQYLRDRDGDYRVDFGYDDTFGCSLTVWLMASGTQKEIYALVCQSDKRIPRCDWEKAILSCNTWNREKRWPKAYLNVSDPERDKTGEVILQENIDLETGVHQELLDDVTMTFLAGVCQFWEWSRGEQVAWA